MFKPLRILLRLRRMLFLEGFTANIQLRRYTYEEGIE